MSEMVERVARAMEAADDSGATGVFGSGPNVDAMARAAIAAMREPTEEMVLAGAGAMEGRSHEHEPQSAVIFGQPAEVWRAMNDQALSDAGEGPF